MTATPNETRDIRPGRQRVSGRAQVVLGAVVPESWHGGELVGVGILYLVLAAVYFVRQRREVPRLMRDGLRTNYADMTREAA